MMIEEYKETVVHELEKAVDEKEVEQIINRSIDQFPEEDPLQVSGGYLSAYSAGWAGGIICAKC